MRGTAEIVLVALGLVLASACGSDAEDGQGTPPGVSARRGSAAPSDVDRAVAPPVVPVAPDAAVAAPPADASAPDVESPRPEPGPCQGKPSGAPCGPTRCEGSDRIDQRCDDRGQCQAVATRCPLLCLLNRCTVTGEGGGSNGSGNGNGGGNGNGNGDDGDDDDDD